MSQPFSRLLSGNGYDRADAGTKGEPNRGWTVGTAQAVKGRHAESFKRFTGQSASQ